MFRQEALNHKKLTWQGKALLLPGVPPGIIITVCLIFLSVFLTFIFAGSYTRRISSTGEVTAYPRPVVVAAGVQGFVTRLPVQEGQSFRKGDPLCVIDVSKSTSAGVVSDNQRQEITRQLQQTDAISARLSAGKRTTLEALEKQKALYTDAQQRSSAILRQAEEGIRIMKKNMENYRTYRGQGLINKDQLSGQVALYYSQHNSLLGLSSQDAQNALQITALESQIVSQAAEFDNRILQNELRRSELLKELTGIETGSEIVIRALSDGRVDSLGVTPGRMVTPGDTLLQFIPGGDSEYRVILWVPDHALPYLRTGDRVNLRYDAFPAEKFGLFPGDIRTISRTPASPQEMMSYAGAPKDSQSSGRPYYKVVVSPGIRQLTGERRTLRPEDGMKVRAMLFMEKRPIWQWMTAPFYRMKQQAAGPADEREAA